MSTTSYVCALSLAKDQLVLAVQPLNLMMVWEHGCQEDNLSFIDKRWGYGMTQGEWGRAMGIPAKPWVHLSQIFPLKERRKRKGTRKEGIWRTSHVASAKCKASGPAESQQLGKRPQRAASHQKGMLKS